MSFIQVLVDRGSQIHRDGVKGGERGKVANRYLSRAMRQSCETLSWIVTDPEFRGFVASVEGRARDVTNARLGDFVRERTELGGFLLIEQQLLARVGADPRATSVLIEQCREVLERNEWHEPAELLGPLDDLRAAVCARAIGIQDDLKGRIARNVGIGMIAVGLGGLNATALAASLGMSGALSAASAALGTSLGQAAFRDAWKALG